MKDNLLSTSIEEWRKNPTKEALLCSEPRIALGVCKTEDDVLDFLKDAGLQSEAADQAIDSAVDAMKTEGTLLRLVASDASEDRDGDTIEALGWELEFYLKNPVLLWSHDRSAPPIGKALSTFVSGGELRQLVKFADPGMSPGDGFVDGFQIGRMYEAGLMNAFSVGFMPKEWSFNEERAGNGFGPPVDFKRQELLENSAVTVPSNRNALAEARGMGIDTKSLIGWAEKILDEDGTRIMVPREEFEKLRKDAGAPLVVPSARIPLPAEAIQDFDLGDLIQEIESRNYDITLRSKSAQPLPANPVEDKSDEASKAESNVDVINAVRTALGLDANTPAIEPTEK